MNSYWCCLIVFTSFIIYFGQSLNKLSIRYIPFPGLQFDGVYTTNVAETINNCSTDMNTTVALCYNSDKKLCYVFTKLVSYVQLQGVLTGCFFREDDRSILATTEYVMKKLKNLKNKTKSVDQNLDINPNTDELMNFVVEREKENKLTAEQAALMTDKKNAEKLILEAEERDKARKAAKEEERKQKEAEIIELKRKNAEDLAKQAAEKKRKEELVKKEAEEGRPIYVGCLGEDQDKTQLDIWFYISSLSPRLCAEKCIYNEYQYIGLVNEMRCYCGNKTKYPERKIRTKEGCRYLACEDGTSPYCGNMWDIAIYATHLAPDYANVDPIKAQEETRKQAKAEEEAG